MSIRTSCSTESFVEKKLSLTKLEPHLSEDFSLNGIRSLEFTTQSWTVPHVSGKRNPDTPVYLLTSGRTASTAESFSYSLKHLERATLKCKTLYIHRGYI